MSSAIINNMTGIENCTYLELGVAFMHNFNSIRCQEKFCVDTNSLAYFTGTTDEFFEVIPADTRYDIIFIDACHDYDYVLKDFNNAIDYCNKWLLIHDMVPPTEDHTAHDSCSDGYKLLYYFLKEQQFEIYTQNTNYGLTFIKMPAKKVYPDESYKNVSYAEFINYLDKTGYKLYSDEEMIEVLNKNV